MVPQYVKATYIGYPGAIKVMMTNFGCLGSLTERPSGYRLRTPEMRRYKVGILAWLGRSNMVRSGILAKLWRSFPE